MTEMTVYHRIQSVISIPLAAAGRDCTGIKRNTKLRRRRSMKILTCWWRIRLPCLSATGCQAAGSVIPSLCLTTGSTYSRDSMTLWRRTQAASTVNSGTPRLSIMKSRTFIDSSSKKGFLKNPESPINAILFFNQHLF